MMKFIRSIPLATCGLALALAALGNLLLSYGAAVRYICGILSLLVLLVFALKVFFDWPHARAELKLPVPLSVLPTATMAIMLLSTYFSPYLGGVTATIWYAALAAHLGIMLLFFKRFIVGFKIGTVYPSWFIVFVGIAVVSVTAPTMGAVPIGQAAFYVGFIFYFIALVLIILRMTKPIFVLEPLRLTTAIFTAPMSLLIVGYFNSFVFQGQLNEALVYLMLAIAVLSYIYVTIKMVTFLKLKFYPTYAAFTFPYVISAMAFRLGAAFLAERGVYFFTPIAYLSQWVAVAVVVYVLGHYLRFFRWVLRF